MTVAPRFGCWWSNVPPWPIEAVIQAGSGPSHQFYFGDPTQRWVNIQPALTLCRPTMRRRRWTRTRA